MNHGEGHPVLHASLDAPRDEVEARTNQLARLEELKTQLAQLPAGSPEADAVRRKAVSVLNQLYEQTKGSWCCCRISTWYHRTSGELGAPLSWTPLWKGG